MWILCMHSSPSAGSTSYMILCKLVDVAAIHPVGYHRELVPFRIHTNEREEVWVLHVLPGDDFPAKIIEPLQ